MDKDPRFDDAARCLVDNRMRRGRLHPLPEPMAPRGEAEGYAVQGRVHALTGAALAGWKIGCTTPVMQRYLDIPQPCAGGIRADQVQASPARLAFDAFVCPGVECEIAVRLGRDLDGARPIDRSAAAAAIETVMPAIEVVDDRYVDWRATPVATLIADDFFQAGIVIGRATALAALPDLAGIPGRMTVDGAEIGRGSGADILGHPLEAVLWLARQLAKSGTVLRAGAIVMCGSVVRTHWAKRGDRVRCELGALGKVALEFA